MTPRQTIFPLFVILIALVWGAWDWIKFHWWELEVEQRWRWLIIVLSIFGLILARILTPFIWQNFS